MSINHIISTPRHIDNNSEQATLERLAREGLHQLFNLTHATPQTVVEQEILRRLNWEINAVVMSGKVNQFLVMRDIVHYAVSCDIPVSPGYGTSAGSLLAYVLGITKVDPYKYELIYENSPFLTATLGVNISAGKCNEIICYVKKQYQVDDDGAPVELVEMPVLDVLQDILKKIRHNQGIVVELDHLPFDDKKTFELLQCGDTLGVYQLESQAARRYLQEWAPVSLRDIFALTALNRIGAEKLIPLVIACKNKQRVVSFHHPLLKPLTMETHGIIIYQDQVIRAAKLLAGYTSEQGYMFQRLLSRKQPEIAEERLKFAEACGRFNGIAPHNANLLFDVLKSCSEYTFRKPHAVAHGLLTYQMAYLKAHYPTEFLAVGKKA